MFNPCFSFPHTIHFPSEGTTAWTQEVEQCRERLPRGLGRG